MKYEEIENRTDKDFKRLTGVEHQTIKQMVTVLESELPNFAHPPISAADSAALRAKQRVLQSFRSGSSKSQS